MYKKIFLVCSLLISFNLFADDIEYKSILECQNAIANYKEKANKKPIETAAGYFTWFNQFNSTSSNITHNCFNRQCTAVYKVGGCGTLFDKTRMLYNLVKPQLALEINRLNSNASSLPSPKLTIICKYLNKTPPVAKGKCSLAK
ncbi:Uncharacterised protein (plasmid) [Legionella adelaidensis]|uniref:Uncharacterized protein n=1 Tax=Legionella adelaidensis TaxID=45056 RepID=A0A0W0R1V3_9GAMM|nr:hypothetical protein [Legionella adelaidensis]KTC65068.1 hypothetical protein Lade_1591 [Legionella adelaidensis]VEH85412.1 Uncharacterised protein [Legionella adelaidensis]